MGETATFLPEIRRAVLGGGEAGSVTWSGEGTLPARFAVTDLASEAIAAAGLAAADFIAAAHGTAPAVHVDRRLSSLWFGSTIQPIGWSIPPPWDAIAGDYEAADGWIRLHTNAPHHRKVALAVLKSDADKEIVTRAVRRWKKNDLENEIVNAGGCAAAMHSLEEWKQHPQGRAVAREQLVITHETAERKRDEIAIDRKRPLRGVRVLDLTRVLAGPIATRFLAGLGATVLRIDPLDWEEPAVEPDVTLGKRCARLDLRDPQSKQRFGELLAQADVLVHGYRPGALDALGFGEMEREAIGPGLIDISLDAYGWSGPWRARRGFDSLVQMSSGIAHASRPTPLPVQALDHATGYIMAAAALSGLTNRLRSKTGFRARTSLARVAQLLIDGPRPERGSPLAPVRESDYNDEVENTAWGPALRLKPPLEIDGCALRWDVPAGRLGSFAPEWPKGDRDD